MKELSGTPLKEFPFKNLFKVGDLVNYQGPLLSLFSNEKGELYLFDWSDNDAQYNRWLVFRVRLNQLLQYLNKNISHHQLISTCLSDCIYSVDMDNELNYNNVIRLNADEIPEEYLPDKDVLHDDNECPHLDKIKLFINELELKAEKIRQKQWKDKFNISSSFYKKMMPSCKKIINREQLIIVVSS